MNKILVTYATMAGSTAEVARAVGEEIEKSGLSVDVLPLEEVKDLQGYQGVVVGGPMIMGWHRAAQRFLKKHRKAFQQIPLAVFMLAMRLTKTDDIGAGEIPVMVDEKLPSLPEKADKLNFKERYASLPNYLRPVIQSVKPAKPIRIGVFGGRMEYGRLKWWAVLFAMLVVQAPAGEKRNWETIRKWASAVADSMAAYTSNQ